MSSSSSDGGSDDSEASGAAATLPGAAVPRKSLSAYSAAFIGAVAFSGKAIVAKLLYRHGVDALAVVALRMLLAWPFFIAMSWWGSRGKPSLKRRDWLTVAGLGFVGYYLGAFLDFLGLQYISASLERLILFVYPTVVALIAAARGHRSVTRTQLIALIVSYAGVVLAFGHEAANSMDRPTTQIFLGASLVLAAAVSYAIYLVKGAEVVARFGSVRLTGVASCFACGICVAQFCLLRPWHAWAEFPAAVWELSVFNATACTVLPMWVTIRSLELIGASATAQVGMIGPISTVALAVWILGEPFTFTLLIGTVLTLAGIFLLVRRPTPVTPIDAS
jgi:drug/metabolite transporter (DMT)-like permease